MSEESSGGGLKNAIIGLITIIVTAIAGVIGKQLIGGEETSTPAAAVAPAPVINLNVQNTNSANSNAGGASSKAVPTAKKEDWKKAEPKW